MILSMISCEILQLLTFVLMLIKAMLNFNENYPDDKTQ